MVYCQKCGKKNEDNARYCSRCGSVLNITASKSDSFEKNISDFTEEVERLGKKAGKTIERGVKNIGEEVKDIEKRVEEMVKEKSTSDDYHKAEHEEYKHLYRSGKNRILAGVCSGVAEYFNVDPTFVRILWVIITFFPPGLGLILYLLFWILVPRNPNQNWN